MYSLSVWLSLSLCYREVICMSCGIDNAPSNASYEGYVGIHTYPWLGTLYYPRNKTRFTTAVVLITKQLVIATALDIDKLPKDDFRSRARVIIGHTCRSRIGIGIRDYTYYPDYAKSTYSTIALIQLDIDHDTTELRPICSPPKTLLFEDFYAMVLSEDCKETKMTVHKMTYVPLAQCKLYYKNHGLDLASMWPSYTACAKSTRGGRCVWRGGAILVMKLANRWSLLGFGVNGPGCHAPARFIDYGMYQEWVRRSIERIGRPSVTRVARNHIVMRRTLSNIQRFGPCDKEEMKEIYYQELGNISYYNPYWKISAEHHNNLTIVANIEYTCLTLQADYAAHIRHKPILRLRRWCSDYRGRTWCSAMLKQTEFQLYVQILFNNSLVYRIKAYGKPVPPPHTPSEGHKDANEKIDHPEILSYASYKDQHKNYSDYKKSKNYPLYGKKRMKSRIFTRPPTTTTKATTTQKQYNSDGDNGDHVEGKATRPKAASTMKWGNPPAPERPRVVPNKPLNPGDDLPPYDDTYVGFYDG